LKFIQAWVVLRGGIMLVLCDTAVPLGKILRLHFRSLALAFIPLRMTGWERVLFAWTLKFIQAWVLRGGFVHVGTVRWVLRGELDFSTALSLAGARFHSAQNDMVGCITARWRSLSFLSG
jgi:hypothetical protein